MNFFDELMEDSNDEGENSVTTIPGIMTGIVKENYNKDYPGMVKVELIQSATEKKVADWIRVATPYGGNGFGMVNIPEIETEVIVAFILGDINHPIVIGSVFNDSDLLPENVLNEENTIKSFSTKGGNQIQISEKEGEETITVQTKGKLSVVFEDKDKKITLKDENGDNSIVIDSTNGEIKLTAAKKITLNTGSEEITLDGQGKKIDVASSNLAVEGKQGIALKTSSTLKAEGTMVELKAQSTLKVESTGILQMKGAMAKIN